MGQAVKTKGFPLAAATCCIITLLFYALSRLQSWNLEPKEAKRRKKTSKSEEKQSRRKQGSRYGRHATKRKGRGWTGERRAVSTDPAEIWRQLQRLHRAKKKGGRGGVQNMDTHKAKQMERV